MALIQTNRELLPDFERFLEGREVDAKRFKFYVHVFLEVSDFLEHESLVSCPVETFEAFFEHKIEQGLSLGRQKAYRDGVEEILLFQEEQSPGADPDLDWEAANLGFDFDDLGDLPALTQSSADLPAVSSLSSDNLQALDDLPVSLDASPDDDLPAPRQRVGTAPHYGGRPITEGGLPSARSHTEPLDDPFASGDLLDDPTEYKTESTAIFAMSSNRRQELFDSADEEALAPPEDEAPDALPMESLLEPTHHAEASQAFPTPSRPRAAFSSPTPSKSIPTIEAITPSKSMRAVSAIPENSDDVELDVVAIVSNELELQGTGEAKRVQEFFKSESSGLHEGEAVAFSRLSTLSPGYQMGGGAPQEDLLSNSDLLSVDDMDVSDLRAEAASSARQRGPSLRDVDLPDHVAEAVRPKPSGRDDIESVKRFSKNLGIRRTKASMGVIIPEKRTVFKFEDVYPVSINTPKAKNFSHPQTVGNLTSGAVSGLALPILFPLVICVILAVLGLTLDLGLAGLVLTAAGFGGTLGFLGLTSYLMKRAAAPTRHNTPNAVYDSYINAIRHRNPIAAAACLARNSAEPNGFNQQPPEVQNARFDAIAKTFRLSRFSSDPLGVVRRAGGAESSGGVIFIAILEEKKHFLLIPAVRFDDGWFITDGELQLREVP